MTFEKYLEENRGLYPDDVDLELLKNVFEDGQFYCNCVHTDNTEVISNLENKIRELEAQIEKMRCCLKCEHYENYKHFCAKNNDYRGEGNSCNKWELRRGFQYE